MTSRLVRGVLAGALLTTMACSDDGGDGTPDTGDADTGTSDTATGDADDAAQPDTDDGGTEDAGGDAEDAGDDADAEGDAQDDADTAIEPPECDEFERPIGADCYSIYNRVCATDADCRAELGETCVREDGETLGLCTYTPFEPIVCPGSAGCASGEGVLRAGFAAATITPQGWETARPGYLDANGYDFIGDVRDPSTFCDCGRDMICPPDEAFADCPSLGEYTGPDADGTEGDGLMQGAWIAGFGISRLAGLCPDELVDAACTGPQCCVSRFAHDDLWARGVVLEQGDTRIALVSLDLVGFFYDDVYAIFTGLDPALGVDWVIISSTHTHEAPDTMGQWGPGVLGSDLPDFTGIVPQWMDEIYAAVTEVVEQAVAELTEVDIYVTAVNTGYEGFATHDSRDPFIFNDLITALHFVRDGGDRANPDDTVGTLLNWHSHPEVLWSENRFISSDFPHYFRQYVEQGLPEVETLGGETLPAIPGLGGIAVYVSGSVGGLLGPGSSDPAVDRAGNVFTGKDYARADALGQRLAERTLTALAESGAPIDDQDLAFETHELMLDVENRQFHTAIFGLNLFSRGVYNWRSAFGLFGPNFPQIRSAITHLRLGPVTFQTFPGELFPEVLTGGYGGPETAHGNPIMGNPAKPYCDAQLRPHELLGAGESCQQVLDRITARCTDGEITCHPCMVDPCNPNPPDLDAAPTEGFLYAENPNPYFFMVGLGNDAIGYLVPDYDYKLGVPPFLNQAPGDHYEETNSVGNVLPRLLEVVGGFFE